MEYFNTTSSKIIFDIIYMLKTLLGRGLVASVTWCYPEDDEDALEVGQDYASLSNVPFNFTALVG